MDLHDVLNLPIEKPLTLHYDDQEYAAMIMRVRVVNARDYSEWHLCVDTLGPNFCFGSQWYEIEYDREQNTLVVKTLANDNGRE